MSKIKKPRPKVAIPDVLRDAALARLDDQEGMLALSVLYECLAPTFEGSTLLRPPGKLSITVEGAHWRLTLDLPYERLSCRLACESLASCLSDMNAYLASGRAVFSPGWTRSKKALPSIDDVVQ